MSKEHTDRLPEIGPAELRPLAEAAIGRPITAPLAWSITPIHGGAATSTALYRVAGRPEQAGAAQPWSLVLKVFRPRKQAEDPRHWNYWRREPLAYQSGLLAQLPGEVVAPRCLGVFEQPGGEVRLWLEDMADLDRRPWSLSEFARAARLLGRLNGAYLAGAPPPSAPWLSQGRLRAWVALCAEAVVALRENLRHPLVRGRFSDAAVGRLLWLWQERETFLDALDRLPRVFGHLDAFPRNLAVRSAPGGDRLVAIDWASIGFGALGEELAPLVGASLIFFEAEVAQARELDALAFQGYLEGLREAGAPAEEAVVRFGYTAAASLRYGLGIALDVGIAAEQQHHAWAEQVLGHSIEEMVVRDAAVADFLVDLIGEARDYL